MADFVYTQACVNFPDAISDWGTTPMRTALFHVGTDVESQRDAADLSGATPLNHCTDTGYNFTPFVHTVLAGSQEVIRDNGNNQAELNLDDASWTMNGDGAADVVSAVVLDWNTSVTDSAPMAHFDVAYTATNSGTFTIQWAAEGAIKLQAV
jgi:hypothetical protein